MSKRDWRTRNLVLAAAVLLAAAAPAMAIPLSFDLAGVNDANLRAHVLFDYDGDDTLDIFITNTSLDAAGPDPRLTAFAFNAPVGVTGIADFAGAPSGWTDSFAPNGINTPGQFGFFDIAGITGPNFNGGSADSGIGRGDTFAFSFELTGPAISTLESQDFLDLFSFDPPGPPTENTQPFIARFQRTGSEGGGSDVAIVPEPAILLQLAMGLGALSFFRRRF